LERKIRVGAVSYLNTKPLVYGFENGMMKEEIDLLFDYPANLAKMLLNGGIDIGLIPVAVLGSLKEYHIITDYCIGASKPVASVCLFSDVPITEVKKVLLDYQSRTSVALLKILLKEHWNITPQLVDTQTGFQEQIKGTTAGLVIGDRALLQRQHSTYMYDLAEAWQVMTGLPFVFAAWVANKQLSSTFITLFNKATGAGLQHINEIVASLNFPAYDMHQYYTNNIDYHLDEQKRAAIQLYLSKLG
jgi:chorismate dehydratase